jgi:drug/metabolite transporter (DMT)-like permease
MPSFKSIVLITTIIISAAFTPIAIRITQSEGMPSSVILFIRLWLISFGLLPVIWLKYRKQLFSLTQHEIALSAIAGFWLALNLFMLFWALEYTSVLITGVLRRTTPLWIIFPEIILLGAIFTRRIWFSLVISLVGVVMVAMGGLQSLDIGTHPLLGASMASFGAICFGIYMLIGRGIQKRMPSLLYSYLVFSSAAIVISVFVLATHTAILGYSFAAYMWTFIVTFLAQVMGHMLINLALKSFSATAIGIILQVGVVLSAVIAVFAFGEIPTFWQIIGSLLVIIGVVLATIEQNQRKPMPVPPS